VSLTIALALVFLVFFTPPVAMAIHAIRQRSWKWMLGSAALCYPVMWYLNATPRFRGALLIMLAYLMGILTLWRGRQQLTWIPVAFIIVFMAWVILTILFVPSS
jgi:hypothetical protein